MMLFIGLAFAMVIARGIRAEQLRLRLLRNSPMSALPDDIRPVHPSSGLPLQVIAISKTETPLATVGLMRPVIAMNRELPDCLTAAELRCALAHEAAHIGRHDGLRSLLIPPLVAVAVVLSFALVCAGGVLAPAPAALICLPAVICGWATHAVLSQRAELACDAAAARHGRLETASALIKAARLTSPRLSGEGQVALADRHIAKRVHALLKAEPGA